MAWSLEPITGDTKKSSNNNSSNGKPFWQQTAAEVLSSTKPKSDQPVVNVTVNSNPQSGPKLVSMNCPNCGASLNVNPKFEQAMCNACGSTFPVDSGATKIETRVIDEAEIKRQEAQKEIAMANIAAQERDKLREFKEKKWIGIVCVGFFVFCFVMLGVMSCSISMDEKRAAKAGLIHTGSSSDFVGEHYRFAESTLRAAGFTNIECIDVDFASMSEEVKSVSIGGVTSFSSDKYFSPDAKVVISYH